MDIAENYAKRQAGQSHGLERLQRHFRTSFTKECVARNLKLIDPKHKFTPHVICPIAHMGFCCFKDAASSAIIKSMTKQLNRVLFLESMRDGAFFRIQTSGPDRAVLMTAMLAYRRLRDPKLAVLVRCRELGDNVLEIQICPSRMAISFATTEGVAKELALDPALAACAKSVSVLAVRESDPVSLQHVVVESAGEPIGLAAVARAATRQEKNHDS